MFRIKSVGKNPRPTSEATTGLFREVRRPSGSSILCNDPHLELNLPSIWYIIHLSAPGIKHHGASLPGAPAVISGFNDSIAWGETNAQRDW